MIDRTREIAIAGLGSGALLFLRFPPIPDQPRFSLCLFHALTGWWCPLCGMTRALAHLVRGEWAQGIAFHVLSPVVLGLIVMAIVRSLLRLGRSAIAPGNTVRV
jgi:hypothetical protein